MARFRVVSKHQVSGWRFLLSRIEHALVRRDAAMLDDPARSRAVALTVGVALAAVCVAGAAVLSFFKPAKTVGNAKIVADQSTSALFVNLRNRLYPVLNLPSARLIVGSPDNPVQVPGDELAKFPRGPLVGIPGAPERMIGTNDKDSYWSVCDTARTGATTPLDPRSGLPSDTVAPVRTTVIGGKLTINNDLEQELHDNQARLVRQDRTNWLIYHHPERGVVRSMINLGDTPVLLALGIDATAPVLPASAGMLQSIPEVPALTVPQIPGAGTEVTLNSGPATRVGTVLTVSLPDRTAGYYLVTEAGLYQVTPVVAAMIRNAATMDTPSWVAVSPNVIASNLRPGTLPLASAYPPKPVELVDTDATTTCFTWSRTGGESSARTAVLVGKQLPLAQNEQTQAVDLVGGGMPSRGATADAAFMPRNSGRFVQVTGATTNSPLRESLWWISDSGVRYGISAPPSENGSDNVQQTVSALGIGAPVPAPWSVVQLFAPGPTLSRKDAEVQHDGIRPDQNEAVLPTGR